MQQISLKAYPQIEWIGICLDFKSSLKNDLRLTSDVQSAVVSYLQLQFTASIGALVSWKNKYSS